MNLKLPSLPQLPLVQLPQQALPPPVPEAKDERRLWPQVRAQDVAGSPKSRPLLPERPPSRPLPVAVGLPRLSPAQTALPARLPVVATAAAVALPATSSPRLPAVPPPVQAHLPGLAPIATAVPASLPRLPNADRGQLPALVGGVPSLSGRDTSLVDLIQSLTRPKRPSQYEPPQQPRTPQPRSLTSFL